MHIDDLRASDPERVEQVAELLVEGFKDNWPDAWPDLDAALAEVRESFGPDRISRVAVDAAGAAVGWVGGLPRYKGHVWELHPLVVRADVRHQGIGRALVADLEAQARARGGVTLWLGTDDEAGQTSLGGADLYPDVLGHVSNLRNLRGHPYTFYERCGFVVVGVLPDANGPGKPDIYMAKRVTG